MHDGDTNPNNEGSRRARAGVGIYDLERYVKRMAYRDRQAYVITMTMGQKDKVYISELAEVFELFGRLGISTYNRISQYYFAIGARYLKGGLSKPLKLKRPGAKRVHQKRSPKYIANNSRRSFFHEFVRVCAGMAGIDKDVCGTPIISIF